MALPHHQISRRPGRFQRFESPASTIVTTGSTIEVAGTAWRVTKERAGVSLSRLRACGPTSKRVTVVAMPLRWTSGAAIGCSLGALALAAPAAATTSSEAIAFLNQQRAANSIPGNLVEDPQRATGCANHNNYQELNGGGHGEDPSRPGYTPEGADPNSGEVLAGAGGFTATSNPWDGAPAHQALLFDPLGNTAGYDESHGFSCLRMGYDFDSPPPSVPKLYAFTGDSGRVNVPTSLLVDGEGPYALQEAVGIPQGVTTGPNILFSERGFDNNGALSSKMTGPDGDVETRMVDSTSQAPDGSGQVYESGGDLVVVNPLDPGTTYDVAVTWENSAGQQLPQSVSFTTAGRRLTQKLSLPGRLPRSRRVSLKAPAAAVGQTATLNVAGVKRQITLKARRTIKVPKPKRGKSVLVAASVAPFNKGDVHYTIRSARKRYR